VSTPRLAGASASAKAKAADAGARKPSPLGADFREHMARIVGRQLSRGHADRFDAIVWANDVGRAVWASAGAMPDGAVLVEELIDRSSGEDRAAGLLVMRKGNGAWSFVSIGADGEVVDDARVAPCATCHGQAPSDFVFRPQLSNTATSAAITATAPTAVATAAATYEARSAGSADAPSRR
jgi:hypothetical protein